MPAAVIPMSENGRGLRQHHPCQTPCKHYASGKHGGRHAPQAGYEEELHGRCCKTCWNAGKAIAGTGKTTAVGRGSRVILTPIRP